MTLYSVYDATTKEGETKYSLSEAKKWIKERIKLGHDASGSKTKVYTNGDWVPCGAIELKGSNKTFIANTKMTKLNY